MGQIRIRAAGRSDYATVERMLQQVQQMHVAWRPDIYRPNEAILPREEYEQECGEQTIFLAEYDGRPAGLLTIAYRRVESPFHVTRDVLFVECMSVDEPVRGKGVGHAFFDFLKQLQRENGCDGIELQVNTKNEAARRMYARYGFTEKSINMELL